MKVHIGAGLGGTIKSVPEDFIVEEVHDDGLCAVSYSLAQRMADALPRRRKEHLHMTMVKRNLTTQRAVFLLAKALHLSNHRLSYAGIKDRVATTAQRVSVSDIDTDQAKKIRVAGLMVKNFKYNGERTFPGDLAGNRFTVTIREIPKKEDDIRWVLDRFRERAMLGLRNYFGAQRFGSRQNNHIIGKYILQDKFREAVEEFLTGSPMKGEEWRIFLKDNWGEWQEALRRFPKEFRLERGIIQGLKNGKSFRNVMRRTPMYKLFVHSYQSYVFNEVLGQIESVPDELPLVGNGTDTDGPIGEILERDGVRTEYFSFRGSARESLFVPKGFKALRVGDGVCTVRFTLPKGSYATVLLNELMSQQHSMP